MTTIPKTSTALNDEAFLVNCVNNLQFFFNNRDLAFIKNLDYCYVGATLAYSQMILLSKTDVDIIGKNDEQLLQAKDKERFDFMLQKIRHYDNQIINEKKASVHLVIALGTEEKPFPKTPLINHLKPLINPDSGNVVGILGILEPLHLLNMPLFILKNCKKYKQDVKTHEHIKLSEAQHITLFLVCNFLSANEIRIVFDALGRTISLSRINALILSLKELFGVATKDALLEKALRMNYHVAAPEALFPEIFYDIDEFLMTII
jgi:hypothetical protein